MIYLTDQGEIDVKTVWEHKGIYFRKQISCVYLRIALH